jgi:RNA polymerase subunit RPABC4/transcription elongation factor Spt4
VLREPGITTCSQCSTLHGSEDRFCPSCGTAATTRAQRSVAGKTAAQ